jgi:hypothetical protein
MAYGWSWNTAIALLVAGTLYWSLRLVMKRRYVNEYAGIRGDAAALEKQQPAFWEPYSPDRKGASFDKAFNWWLLTFGFLRSKEPALIVLCIAVQVTWLIAMYFVIAEPIYIGSP